MLPRIITGRRYVAPSVIGSQCRTYSSKYSSKVRAFPFAISPADAIIQLGPYASQSAALTGLLGSLGARFLPGFGFKPLQPTRIQPVYLPAWFVDAEVEVKAAADNESQPHTVSAFLHNSYMPGFVFEPLSRLSFNHTPTADPIPFSDDMEYQFKNKVLCLPYVISPLSLPEAARSMSYKEATISDELRFIPHSVKPNLLAAYPVLIPVYLAQYTFHTFQDEQASVTLILEAHLVNGRILCEQHSETIGFPDTQITTQRGCSVPFAGVSSVVGLKTGSNATSELVGYLDDMISAPGAAEALASGGVDEEGNVPVEMDDLRVREYTTKETEYNRRWLVLSAGIAGMKLVIERLSQITNTKGFLFKFDFVSLPKQVDLPANNGEPHLDQLKRSILEQIAEMDSTRERTKPQWWKDWESATSPKGGIYST